MFLNFLKKKNKTMTTKEDLTKLYRIMESHRIVSNRIYSKNKTLFLLYSYAPQTMWTFRGSSIILLPKQSIPPLQPHRIPAEKKCYLRQHALVWIWRINWLFRFGLVKVSGLWYCYYLLLHLNVKKYLILFMNLPIIF